MSRASVTYAIPNVIGRVYTEVLSWFAYLVAVRYHNKNHRRQIAQQQREPTF